MKIGLLASVLLLGCVSTSPVEGSASSEPDLVTSCDDYQVYVNPDVPLDWQRGFLRAVGTWTRALGPALHLSYVEHPRPACTLRVDVASIPDDVWANTDLYGLPGRPTEANVKVSGKLAAIPGVAEEDMAYAIFLHEIGHFVLGPGHNTDSNDDSVMWPFIRTPGRLGCTDVQRACAAWGCPIPQCRYGTWVAP